MSAPLTAAERAELAAVDAWKAFGRKFGWRLYGCNGPYMATFYRPNDSQHFHVGGNMRDEIAAALTSAAEAVRREERERCAGIARGWYKEQPLWAPERCGTHSTDIGRNMAAEQIAAAIEAGTEEAG